MYDDPYALLKFEEFQARYRFNAIIETGTHRGNAALWFTRYRDMVCTIEINPEFKKLAALNFLAERFVLNTNERVGPYEVTVFQRSDLGPRPKGGGVRELKRMRTICSFLGNSPEVLDAMLTRRGPLRPPFLFYLDAHWEENWPILDELRVIAKHNIPDSCIIIHDFQVPGQPFGYDEYHGQPLNMDYVREDLFKINPNYVTFYSEKASVNMPGILYVVPPD